MSLHKLVVVIGAATAKVGPVFFGFLLSKYWGHSEYATFLLLANFAAFISSFPTLGGVPQILSSGRLSNPGYEIKRNINVSISLVILFQLGYLLYWFFVQKNGSNVEAIRGWSWFLSSLFYSIGLVLYGLANALLNAKERWLIASLCSVGVYLSPVVFAFAIGGSLEGRNYFIIVLYAFLFFSSCAVYFLSVTRFFKIGFSFSPKVIFFEWRGLLKHFKVSFFGVAYLWGFYLAAEEVNRNFEDIPSAIYSLSFQLFSVSIFIPSVLGGVLVPYLSNRINRKSNVGKVKMWSFFVYIFIASSFSIIVMLLSDYLIKLYGFENYPDMAPDVFFKIQIAAVLASVAAYRIQELIVYSRYLVLSAGGCVWLVVMMYGIADTVTLQELVLSFVWAYFAVLLFYLFDFVFIKMVLMGLIKIGYKRKH